MFVVKLAMCPAMRAPEDARVEEGPEATVGKLMVLKRTRTVNREEGWWGKGRGESTGLVLLCSV